MMAITIELLMPCSFVYMCNVNKHTKCQCSPGLFDPPRKCPKDLPGGFILAVWKLGQTLLPWITGKMVKQCMTGFKKHRKKEDTQRNKTKIKM